jgi:hypothetical protein
LNRDFDNLQHVARSFLGTNEKRRSRMTSLWRTWKAAELVEVDRRPVDMDDLISLLLMRSVLEVDE